MVMPAAKLILILVAVALLLAAGLSLQRLRSQRRPVDVTLGAGIFPRDCASCHGASGEGQGSAPPLNQTGHAHHHPDWELYSFIAEGRTGLAAMPAWKGRLSKGEIRAVIAYIKTLWTEQQRRFQEEINRARPSPP
ncbi:MAG: c-type cytochrome [bacterium]